jgi:hypothetical protein
MSLCLLLVGCAQTGPPLPPSLELPKPPSDVRAIRKGNTVTLTWSEPTLTTDRQSVRYLGPTRVCRSAQPDMTTCGTPVQIVPPPPTVPTPTPKTSQRSARTLAPFQTYTDTLPANLQSDDPNSEVTYAVEVMNRNARGAGLSNRVHVPAIITIPAPADLTTELTGDGVVLKWTSTGEPPAKPGVQYRYRIYRRNESAPGSDHNPQSPGTLSDAGEDKDKDRIKDKGIGVPKSKSRNNEAIAAEVPIGPAGPARFLDSIEWERTYQYRITAVTILSRPGSEVQVEGDDSPSIRVVAHDIFPPSTPSGLQAVYSGEGQKPFIDLIWAPVTSADLAGYNIYRTEATHTQSDEAQPNRPERNRVPEDRAPDNHAAVKLNSELVKAPAYRDTAVAPGKTYTYSVSAVDVRGNESPHSEPATETVPAP